MPRVRVDASSVAGGTMLNWYAQAVGKLMEKPLTDRTSWRYLGAIHGFVRDGWIARDIIEDTDAVPPPGDNRVLKQCQHATWYFLPWHRGYLHAFESIIAATVKALPGGPDDWALPYWNYLSGDPDDLEIPAAFTAPKMANGVDDNPLYLPPDKRPHTDLDANWIKLDAMANGRFTSVPGTAGFGGGITHFNHSGGAFGALENNPHNAVHVLIGDGGGFMEDPDYAALDPIFWLHHCNIDRLWAAWLTQKKNKMEYRKAWLRGPARHFEMPGPDGQLHKFTPADTLPGKTLAPTYDDLQIGTGLPPVAASLEEVTGAAPMPAQFTTEEPPPANLVGSNSGKITITGAPATTEVKLQPEVTEAVGLVGEERVFLNLENVRGTAPSARLMIRIGAPSAGAALAEDSSYSVPVALFGLKQATASDGEHGGNGINVAVDITEIAGKLQEEAGASIDQLQVRIEQQAEGEVSPITVDRISIYKQPVG